MFKRKIQDAKFKIIPATRVTKRKLKEMLTEMGMKNIRYSGKLQQFFYKDPLGKTCVWKLAWLVGK